MRLLINAQQAQTQKVLPAEKTEDGGSPQMKGFHKGKSQTEKKESD